MQVLFDSKCDFCNAFIAMIPAFRLREPVDLFDLRSREARLLLRENGVQFVNMNTIYFLHHGSVNKKSAAIFGIFGHASGVYHYLSYLRILPRSFTDYVYDVIARNRYAISSVLKKLRLIKSGKRSLI